MQHRALKITIGLVVGVVAVLGVVVVLLPLKVGGPRAGARQPSQVDAILQSLEWGHIAFTAPSTMQYKQPQIIELLLSPTESPSELQRHLDERRLDERHDVEVARIRISDRMSASLEGEGFSIKTIVPPVQAVSRQEPTRWAWEVTPEQHGTHFLYVGLSAHLDVAGVDTPHVVKTFSYEMRVDITASQRISAFVVQNWQWLWTALFVPIFVYLWKRRKAASHRRSRRPLV